MAVMIRLPHKRGRPGVRGNTAPVNGLLLQCQPENAPFAQKVRKGRSILPLHRSGDSGLLRRASLAIRNGT